MGTIEKPNTFSAGAVVVAAEHNANFDTIYTEFNGNINGANIDVISTAGKVSGASFTGLANIPSGAGVIPSANVGNTFPTGGIIMWSGSIATIPSGWALCNGSNGTPDLRDKFIVGAKQDDSGTAKTNVTGSLTQTGGAATDSITLTSAELPSHTHDIQQTYWTGEGGNGRTTLGSADYVSTPSTFHFANKSGSFASKVSDESLNLSSEGKITASSTGTGSAFTVDILNPYYALAFIMKT